MQLIAPRMNLAVKFGSTLLLCAGCISSATSESLPTPPALPSFCGGILCAEIDKVYVNNAWTSPVIVTEYTPGEQHARYGIKYPTGDVLIDIAPSGGCKTKSKKDRDSIELTGPTAAVAMTCSRGPNDDSTRWAVRLWFSAKRADDLRAVVRAIGTLWIIDFRPDLVWAKEGVITMGPPIEIAPGPMQK